MKPGSASIDRHADTQAPHWMQATAWVTSTIASAGTMYSRSGGGPSGSSHGVTRRYFSQWVDSMSTTRSLITGMLPIGSTRITPGESSASRPVPPVESDSGAAGSDGFRSRVREIRAASSAASPICVLQASVDWPLTLTPQEPQIAARQEQRTAREPSVSSRAWSRPSRTERLGSSSTSKSSQ